MPPILPIILEQNSEEINEIIESPPSWILRSGITVVLFIIVAIVAICGWIEYPDVVRTQLMVNSVE
ncbi:MAG: hypothetical protein EOO89_28625, partial [Pedobacter sp.]